jgi:hypothetical protein
MRIYGIPAALLVLLVAAPVTAQQKKGAHPDSVHARHHARDTTFAALQARGLSAMGVDQYTSVHTFDVLEDGGRIALERAVDDAEGVEAIRTHLREIAEAFRAGDFATPFFVHDGEVPGTRVMARKKAAIEYVFRPLERGGEVLLTTRDREALAAITEFMRFQREAHRASGRGR